MGWCKGGWTSSRGALPLPCSFHSVRWCRVITSIRGHSADSIQSRMNSNLGHICDLDSVPMYATVKIKSRMYSNLCFCMRRLKSNQGSSSRLMPFVVIASCHVCVCCVLRVRVRVRVRVCGCCRWATRCRHPEKCRLPCVVIRQERCSSAAHCDY